MGPVVAGVMLLTPWPASAQTLQSFEDLALRINLGDALHVEEQTGRKTTGRLTGLTLHDLTIEAAGDKRVFAGDTVHEVAARDHALARGALIGAGAFAVLGAAVTCAHGDEKPCGVVGPLRAAPIGAGVGLAIGALLPRWRLVYRAAQVRASVPPARAPGEARESLLETLGLRVDLDDHLQIVDPTGRRIDGRLTRLTDDQVTLDTPAGEEQFTRETIRRVAVRHRLLRAGALAGAGAGAAVGALSACVGADRDECPDAPMIGAALGAGAGLLTGALLHRTTVVYPEARPQTRVVPMGSPSAIGIQVTRQW